MIYVKEFRAPQTYHEGTNKEHITKGVNNGHPPPPPPLTPS